MSDKLPYIPPRKAKEVIADFYQERLSGSLRRSELRTLLHEFGQEITKAEFMWNHTWQRSHCAVCGERLMTSDPNSSDFNGNYILDSREWFVTKSSIYLEEKEMSPYIWRVKQQTPLTMNTSTTVRIYRIATHVMRTNRTNLSGIEPADFYRSSVHDLTFTDDIEAAKADFGARWTNNRHEGTDGDAVEYELCYADIAPEDGEDAQDIVNGLYTFVPKSIKWQTLEDAGCPSGDASWCAFHRSSTSA